MLVDRAYVSAARAGTSGDSLTVSVVVPAADADKLRLVALAATADSVYAALLTGVRMESSELARCG